MTCTRRAVKTEQREHILDVSDRRADKTSLCFEWRMNVREEASFKSLQQEKETLKVIQDLRAKPRF